MVCVWSYGVWLESLGNGTWGWEFDHTLHVVKWGAILLPFSREPTYIHSLIFNIGPRLLVAIATTQTPRTPTVICDQDSLATILGNHCQPYSCHLNSYVETAKLGDIVQSRVILVGRP